MMQAGDEHIWALNFPVWREVTGRHSVADLFPPGKRCGICVLGFATGERYVGRAVDVVRRFSQHRKNHGDVTHMTFKGCEESALDNVEQHCIHTLEAAGLRLRNLAHMSVVQGERDLDLVVSPGEQELWLRGELDTLRDAEQAVQDEALRLRYRRRSLTFMTLPHAQNVLCLLGLYLQAVVPFPRRTELSFWMVSCLPYGLPPKSDLRCRVSLNMQEVFSLSADEQGVYADFHLAGSPLEAEFGSGWRERLTELGLEASNHRYRPGGHDQFHLRAGSFEEGVDLICAAESGDAMRLFNLRLMRKGATYYSKYHCLDLVDAALHVFSEREREILEEEQQS